MAQFIVLVDDEEGILKALRRELDTWARDRGLEIRTFSSGEDTLKFLARNHLDVVMVISDQRMPGIKGHELLAQCNQRYPAVQLLMLTGYTDIQDITRAIRSGITSFILKPWEHDDLLYEVTKAYNLFETRERNRRYLKLIRNELSLAALLRKEVSRPGDYEYNWCRVGSHYNVSPEQTARGVDLIQHVPIGEDRLLILAAHIDSDGVRGSMIGGAALVRVFSTAVARTPVDRSDLSVLHEELTAVLKSVEKEMPAVMIRYALGMLARTDATLQYTGNGYPPWVLLQGEDIVEIETEDCPGSGLKTQQVRTGDMMAIASPGALASIKTATGSADANGVDRQRVLAHLLRETDPGFGPCERAKGVLDRGDLPDEPTDVSLMVLEVGDLG